MKQPNAIKTAMPAVILALAGLMVAGNVQAKTCPLVPDGRTSMQGFETAQLLRNGKFAQLEAALEKQHRKNLSADGGDLLTLRNIDELLKMGLQAPQDENLLSMWAAERPQSFFGQLVAGVYYADRGGNALGGQPMSRVRSNVLKEAKQLDETATAHLQKAMQLDARSALPQSLMLGIAARARQAGGKSTEEWLQAANQADPKNLAARINATRFLSPRWGGSFELLDQMVQQAKKSLSAADAHYLEYNVLIAKASHEEVIAKNTPQAQALYTQAKEMCENSEFAQEGVIRTYK
jgi:hypothetical protein